MALIVQNLAINQRNICPMTLNARFFEQYPPLKKHEMDPGGDLTMLKNTGASVFKLLETRKVRAV